jgi:hypothetical protein
MGSHINPIGYDFGTQPARRRPPPPRPSESARIEKKTIPPPAEGHAVAFHVSESLR